MGFNISGIAINKNFKNNFEALQKDLGWQLEKQSEITFEQASSNWKEEGICDVYFSENGTLLFINMDMCTMPYKLKSANTLTFAYSETSMAFCLNYCIDGMEKRSIMEVNGDIIRDEGDRMDTEGQFDDTSDKIWQHLEAVLGKRFGSIEPGEQAIRYVFTKNKRTL